MAAMRVLSAVKEIMDRCPEARYNNNLLAVLFWQYVDNIHIPPNVANQIANSTSLESISRARRELIERERKMRKNK